MLAEKVRLARKDVKAAQNLILQAELKARRRVLRRLGYVDSEGVVTVKGRAAAEIQSADELVLTELMFNGVFKVGFLLCASWTPLIQPPPPPPPPLPIPPCGRSGSFWKVLEGMLHGQVFNQSM